MNDKLDELKLCALTSADPTVAIAECIDGLGCSVFADGAEITSAWASRQVEELVGIFPRNGAVIDTQAHPQYFLLGRETESDTFQLLDGPLTADDLIVKRAIRAAR